VAKATASAPAETRLFADIASQMVDKLRMHRTGASCFVNRLSRAHVPEAASSLVHGLVRPSCAVVGNSPLILGQRAGPSIDSHDVVIRFNFAPTCGFERDVGTKTSVRVMGKTWVWSSQDAGDGEEPIIIHRYNTNDYFTEDLQLNRGYNIATLTTTSRCTGLDSPAVSRACLEQRACSRAPSCGACDGSRMQ